MMAVRSVFTRDRYLLLAVVAVVCSGCRICASPDLDSYTTYGGAWERTDRDHGRVGSVFDPAGVRVAGELVSTETDSPKKLEPKGPSLDDVDGPMDELQDGRPQIDDVPKERRGSPEDLRDLELEDIQVELMEAPPLVLPSA